MGQSLPRAAMRWVSLWWACTAWVIGAGTADGKVLSEGSDSRSISGMLHVESTPTGADVYISPHPDEKGEFVGKTPLEKWLLPFAFWVTVEYPGRVSETRRMAIRSRDINHMVVRLDYRMNPYARFGHVTFWPSAAFFLVGAASVYPTVTAGDRRGRRLWMGTLCAGFGAGAVLMSTGLILWLLSPGDAAYYKAKYGVAGLGPTGTEGVLLHYRRTF